MLDYALSAMVPVSDLVILVFLVKRFHELPLLSRWTVIGCGSGLMMASRFAEGAYGAEDLIWIIGGSVMLLSVAVRHFRAIAPFT